MTASVGAPAPAFTCADSNGKQRSLGEFKGRTVVLEWTNRGCPYVRKHYDKGNVQGLQPTGNGNWEANYATGEPVHGAPGDGNFGNLRAGALEDSNIDITGELVAMMTAQRAYQANAQTIKTQDQVFSTLLNMR